MMRVSVYIIPFIIFTLLAVLLWFGLSNDPRDLPSARIGQAVPEFKLENLLTEQTVIEGQLKGRVSLLNVWASWCPACRFEHGIFVKLAEQGITIYGLNYKDKHTMALQWLSAFGNPYELTIFDPRGDLALDLGVYGAPETFLIDAEGIIRYRHAGPLTQAVWEEVFAPKYRELIGLSRPQ